MTQIANGYLQLGIAGATLFILLIFVINQSKSADKREEMQFTKIDKLCDKIDNLVDAQAKSNENLNKVLLANDKDQKETIKLLNTLLNINLDVQKKVVRIDDRTYNCLGTPGERSERVEKAAANGF